MLENTEEEVIDATKGRLTAFMDTSSSIVTIISLSVAQILLGDSDFCCTGKLAASLLRLLNPILATYLP